MYEKLETLLFSEITPPSYFNKQEMLQLARSRDFRTASEALNKIADHAEEQWQAIDDRDDNLSGSGNLQRYETPESFFQQIPNEADKPFDPANNETHRWSLFADMYDRAYTLQQFMDLCSLVARDQLYIWRPSLDAKHPLQLQSPIGTPHIEKFSFMHHLLLPKELEDRKTEYNCFLFKGMPAFGAGDTVGTAWERSVGGLNNFDKTVVNEALDFLKQRFRQYPDILCDTAPSLDEQYYRSMIEFFDQPAIQTLRAEQLSGRQDFN